MITAQGILLLVVLHLQFQLLMEAVTPIMILTIASRMLDVNCSFAWTILGHPNVNCQYLLFHVGMESYLIAHSQQVLPTILIFLYIHSIVMWYHKHQFTIALENSLDIGSHHMHIIIFFPLILIFWGFQV